MKCTTEAKFTEFTRRSRCPNNKDKETINKYEHPTSGQEEVPHSHAMLTFATYNTVMNL